MLVRKKSMLIVLRRVRVRKRRRRGRKRLPCKSCGCFRRLDSRLKMVAPEGGNEEEEWERLFNEEKLKHIQPSIGVMENEIYGEFIMNLGRDVVISNYWRLKLILSHSMNERDSYVELIRITVGTFKDNAERNIVHMCSLLRLSAPHF